MVPYIACILTLYRFFLLKLEVIRKGGPSLPDSFGKLPYQDPKPKGFSFLRVNSLALEGFIPTIDKFVKFSVAKL